MKSLIVVNAHAVHDARRLGIYGDTAKRVARMVRRSAVITHRDGNRRFGDYLFWVVDGEVTVVSLK